ncbi:MAG: hypothetical protein HRT64_13590 [Erythrobacter sp.]|nr:hypothetical protein [Erythrobacter sp.]
MKSSELRALLRALESEHGDLSVTMESECIDVWPVGSAEVVLRDQYGYGNPLENEEDINGPTERVINLLHTGRL